MAKGGARYGAGRPAHRVKAEHCRRIDARHWAKEKILQRSSAGAWGWTDAETGERTASISYASDTRALTLSFAVNGQAVRQLVPIWQTACHYGGLRYWFGCPCCGQRVAILYLRGRGFGCRRCSRIAYASQSEDSLGRAWRKQLKIERRLGEGWARPKGMWSATYDRLLAGIAKCEERREAGLAAYLRAVGVDL